MSVGRAIGQRRPPTERSVELRLARLRVRTGDYVHARAELETMAGWGLLDDDSLLDLAEVRWRTGDVSGAGDAAEAYLASGHEDGLALVIAAEAMAALGRPTEARRLAGRAVARGDLPIDAIFAGIRRSSIWPRDPADPGEPVGTLFTASGVTSGSRPGAAPGSSGEMRGAESSAASSSAPGQQASSSTQAPAHGPGLWDAHPETHQHVAEDVLPDPQAELAAARETLAAGDLPSGAIHLAIALRLSPVLAPAVLDVAAQHPGPSFELIRGDAYRIVGHETEARRAYAAAAAGLTAVGGTTPDQPQTPTEEET